MAGKRPERERVSMKGSIPFIVIILVIIGVAGWLINDLQGQVTTANYEMEAQKLRVDFAMQAPFSRQVEGDSLAFEQVESVKAHVKGFEALYKKYPGLHREDEFILDMEEKAAQGTKDKAKTAQYRERYDYLKEMWEGLSKSGYKPLASGQDKSLRVDLVRAKPVNQDGNNSLRMDMTYWGPVAGQINFGAITIHILRDGTYNDEKGRPKEVKSIMKFEGQGAPYVLVDKPHEWIKEFPPTVMVGYYLFPLFPPDASKFTIDMNYTTRTVSGGSVNSTVRWEDMDVPATWKGPNDPQWEEEPKEAEEEELKEAGFLKEEEEEEGAKKK
jgi:hypothetical protein